MVGIPSFSGGAIGIGKPVAGGTNNTLLSKDNSGNLASTNTLTSVTPSFGATAASSLALGGATIGANALAVTGSVLFNTGVLLPESAYIQWGNASGAYIDAVSNVARFNGQFLIRSSAQLQIGLGAALEFGNTAVAFGTSDLFIRRDAANTLALRNGMAAQTFNVYNTYTDASNYERLVLKVASNGYTLTAEKAGTGAVRSMVIGGGTAISDVYFDAGASSSINFRSNNGANLWQINPTGHLVTTDNTYDIGASGATRPRTAYLGTSAVVGGAANGTLGLLGVSGSKLEVLTLTELTTIAAAATTDTAIQIPANAILLAVQVRTTTVIPTAATYTVTGTGSSTVFNTAAVSAAATSTDPGTAAGAYYNATAQTIRITPNAQPADNTGRVRVTIRYILSTPPTS